MPLPPPKKLQRLAKIVDGQLVFNPRRQLDCLCPGGRERHWLQSDGAGNWRDELGTGLQELAGCIDVDIAALEDDTEGVIGDGLIRVSTADYLAKPYEIDDLRLVVRNTLETARLRRENHRLAEELRRLAGEALFHHEGQKRGELRGALKGRARKDARERGSNLGRLEGAVVVAGEQRLQRR